MNPNITDISAILTYVQENGILLVFKILTLLLLFVFIIYNFIVVNRVRSLNRTLYLDAAHASALIMIFAVAILMASISLFVITIVIV